MLKNYPRSEGQVNPSLLWPRKISLVHNNPNSAVFDHPNEIKILSSTSERSLLRPCGKEAYNVLQENVDYTGEAIACQRKEYRPPRGAFRRGVVVRGIPGAAK